MISGKLAELALTAERFSCGLRRHHCEVDGHRWHYLEGGADTAETLVLLHGFGADKDNWNRFAGALRRDYHILVPDLPGFGENACLPGQDYSMRAQAERLHAFLQRRGVSRCHLAGSSMGGHLSAIYAYLYPEAVMSVGLYNNGGIKAPRPCKMELALAEGENLLLVTSEKDFERLIALVCEKKPFIPGLVRRHMARAAMARRNCIAGIFTQYQREIYGGLESVLDKLSQPVWVVWGTQDRVLDVSSCEVMRPLLPSAEFDIMDNTGHLPMLERPKLCAQRYRDFLRRRAQG